jgi:hypothetical protein
MQFHLLLLPSKINRKPLRHLLYSSFIALPSFNHELIRIILSSIGPQMNPSLLSAATPSLQFTQQETPVDGSNHFNSIMYPG